MTISCHCEKNLLRKEFAKKRLDIPLPCAEEASLQICGYLLGFSALVDSRLIAAYLSDGTEPELSIFIATMCKKGASFCFPRFSAATGSYEMALVHDLDKDLQAGRYGILEPASAMRAVPEEELSRIPWLIPGVAFDSQGGRLGRGKGVYDRLLRCASGLKIGVFFEVQNCSKLPRETHDCPLDWLVTETGLRSCAQNTEHKRRCQL